MTTVLTEPPEAAEYHNGVLEIYLPIPETARVSGTEIEVKG